MQAIKLILFFGTFFCLFNACIEPFTPNIDEGEQLIVINGLVTNEEGYHSAEISKTSSYNNREYKPLNDCRVKIINDRGNEFEMEQYADGKYRTWIEKQYLQTGEQFKIEVVLDNGDGKKYESEFDTLLPCPDIDNLYFDYQNIIPDDPEKLSETGVQFYIDFDATGGFANNYRWEAIETWEYHSKYEVKAIYYGIAESCCDFFLDSRVLSLCGEHPDTCIYGLNIKFLNPEILKDWILIDSLNTCWKTSMASDIFTYTSRQKRDKKVFGLPLNLVTNKENKLTVKYSILIKQLSLSDIAFKFWNQLQSQSQETGGLYETQPYELDGNIRCTDNENEIVIGVFSASSIKTKRFTGMFNANPEYPYCDDIFSDWESLEYFLWGGHEVWTTPPLNLELPDTPLYLQTFLNDEGNVRQDTFALTEQSCYDCTVNGGTRTKPDFW